MLLQWSILEGTRFYTINLVTITTFCNSYLNIASHLQRKSFGDKLISLYNQFRYINQIGQAEVANISGVLMGFGVFLFVVLNYVSICELNRLPAELYFVNIGFAVVAYCVVFQTLTKLVNRDAICSRIITSWRQTIHKMPGYKAYWVRIVRSQRPVAVYYALTKFDKETERHYHATILDQVIDALLLF